MDFFLTLQNVSVLFLLIVIGFVVGKLNIVTERGQRELAQLVLKVTMPATIIMAMQQPLTKDKIDNILYLLMIMVGVYIYVIISSIVLSKLFPGFAPHTRDILSVAIMLSNTSFMGYPIILTLLGEEYLFYTVICSSLVFEVTAWTLGRYLVGRNDVADDNLADRQGKIAALKKALINPGIISLLIGGSLFISQISIPEPLRSTMTMLSKATSPLAMLVVGMILSRTAIKEAIFNKPVYMLSAIKLLINPAIILVVLKLLGLSGFNLIIPVVTISMPTAAYVAMFSEQAGNDAKLASQIVFVTSLISLLTIPLITSFI